MTDWRVPLSDLDYGDEEATAVAGVLTRKWLSMGPEVQAFEREFAAMQSAPFALAVSSATAGLHLALLALDVGRGDEVVQPALNFVAMANVTRAAGARPVFADICSVEEPTIDPAAVSRAMTPRTKAVVVMHYGGNLCRMDELTALCKSRGVALIEDACHAVGAAYRQPNGAWPNGVSAGSIGDVGTFSFFANKNLATGEGGMIVTSREDVAARIRLLRSHGMTSLTWDRHKGHAGSYDVMRAGFNYRLDELRAALGRVQLSKLMRNNQRRRALLAEYREHLTSLEDWGMPFADAIADSSGHLMVAVAPNGTIRSRAVQALRDAGIQSSLHYPSIADFTGYQGISAEPLALTRAYTSRAITLPLYPDLDPVWIPEIVAILRTAS